MTAVLLHGWPGAPSDYRKVVARLEAEVEVVVPDLLADPPKGGAPGHAARLLPLVAELDRPVLVGYDIGSRIAQTIALEAPDAVRGLVLSPPLPGIGERILSPDAVREFWYQPFHRLELATELVAGPEAVRAYLRHFWSHWSAEGWELPEEELEALVERYSAPGAFEASIAWYRAGSGAVARSLAETVPAPEDRLAVRTLVLWPTEDPLFPVEWADRLDAFFTSADVTFLPGVGHFTPLEAPGEVVAAVRALLA